MFVEGICGKGRLFPNHSPKKIGQGHLPGLARQIQTGGLQGGIGAGIGIKWVLSRHQGGLGAGHARGILTEQFPRKAQGPERGIPQQAFANGQKGLGRLCSSIGLGNADHSLLALDLEDCAEGIGLVQAVGAPQGRVRHGDGVYAQVFDLH